MTAAWRAHKRGACFANPCYTQIHPTCIPISGTHQSKLTLMSESLRNDGRMWVPKQQGDSRRPADPEEDRDYYLDGNIRASATSCRATSSRATRRSSATKGRGVGESGLAVYLDFVESIARLGVDVIRTRYGNLFDMYHEDHRRQSVPDADAHLPAIHYTMGGLWVDYNLMSTSRPARPRRGELLGSRRQPAGRAAPLMQGLADGYFVIPYTLADYLGRNALPTVSTDHDAFREAQESCRSGSTPCSPSTVRRHRASSTESRAAPVERRGHGAQRSGPDETLRCIRQLRDGFWQNLSVPGPKNNLNKNLEYAGRVADYPNSPKS